MKEISGKITYVTKRRHERKFPQGLRTGLDIKYFESKIKYCGRQLIWVFKRIGAKNLIRYLIITDSLNVFTIKYFIRIVDSLDAFGTFFRLKEIKTLW